MLNFLPLCRKWRERPDAVRAGSVGAAGDAGTNQYADGGGRREPRGPARDAARAGELGGYFIAITVWSEIVGAAATGQPWVPVIAKFFAAGFLIWSAWTLWRHAGRNDVKPRGITLARVFLTTVSNPKGLVFAFAIFPQMGFVARLPYLGVFAGLVAVSAVGWMVLGAVAARSVGGWLTSARVERAMAVVLVVFGILLVVQTVEGLVVTD